MECPFELPVRLNKKGHFVCGKGKSYRDLTPRLSMLSKHKPYIVQAINSHEKLVDVCRNALTSLAITMLPRLNNNVASDNDIIKIVISSLEQALKEAKKE